jgi:ACS family hexuronate transporter-like MFS transporter
MVNYMDRLTLNQTSVRVMREVGFDVRGYGEIESAFAYAFAVGAILAGWLADRWNVRLIYPAALLAWSAAGFATGLVNSFFTLLLCRFLLGLSEAGHWPCALRTTQRILPPAERSMGNSILQSGAAVGAILTPLLILALPSGEGTWRYPFLIVGGAGMTWVILWLVSVRSADLACPRTASSPAPVGILLILLGLLGVKTLVRLWPKLSPDFVEPSPELRLCVSLAVSILGIGAVVYWLVNSTGDDTEQDRTTFLRRFGVLLVVVVVINGTWHFFRAWLPLFLQEQHGYPEKFMQWFLIAYYVSTDAGSLTSGFVGLKLARRDFPVHASRLTTFGVCAGLCVAGGLAAALLPRGSWLLGALLVVGFGALGMFPHYYSFSQELTSRHQGKVTGALGCSCWLAMAPLHETVGETVKQTGNYSLDMALAAAAPLLALAVLALFWGTGSGKAVEKMTRPKAAAVEL